MDTSSLLERQEDISLEPIIKGCLKNDRASQEALYRHFYPKMMPVCMGYTSNPDDAVDIYNRAFLKVFNKIGDFKGDGEIGAWIRRIVVHTAIDFIRRADKYKYHTDIEEARGISGDSNPMVSMLTEDIRNLMKKLPPMQRAVVNLYIVEGYGHKDIASQLEISEGTSKWHLSEGRKRLKQLLTEAGITQ